MGVMMAHTQGTDLEILSHANAKYRNNSTEKHIYCPRNPTIYYIIGFCSRYHGELKDNLEKCIYSIQGETDNWAWALSSDACSNLSLNSRLIKCPFSQEFQASLQTYMHTKILVIWLMIA